MSGAVPLVQTADSESNHDVVPQQVMNDGHHFDDIGGESGRYNWQQQYNYASRSQGLVLPSDVMHFSLADAGLTRPTVQQVDPPPVHQ